MQNGTNQKKQTRLKWTPIFGDADSLTYASLPEHLKIYFNQLDIPDLVESYEVSKLFLKSIR